MLSSFVLFGYLLSYWVFVYLFACFDYHYFDAVIFAWGGGRKRENDHGVEGVERCGGPCRTVEGRILLKYALLKNSQKIKKRKNYLGSEFQSLVVCILTLAGHD